MTSENLALSKKRQSSFDVTVRKIRKKIKADGGEELVNFKPGNKGVVRLSCIPHGFFEYELRKYFSQFGKVTKVRVARSRKTGNSKGFAFVEFEFPDVARVVAETMNNYLMFDRILKAKYIPPEEQKFNYFLGVQKNFVPTIKKRKETILKYNRMLSKTEKKTYAKKVKQQLIKKLNKIKKLGIDYDFKPVNEIPLKETQEKPILTIDESDEEIAFKVPPNVKVVRKKSKSGEKREDIGVQNIINPSDNTASENHENACKEMNDKDDNKSEVKLNSKTFERFSSLKADIKGDISKKNSRTTGDKKKKISQLLKNGKKNKFFASMELSFMGCKTKKTIEAKSKKTDSSEWIVEEIS